MICYKDMTFCARRGCSKESCPLNPAHIDWSFGLPVSVADFWGKSDECPVEEPKLLKAFATLDGGAIDGN